MEPGEPPLPTFLIIGAQKSATRWLRFNLGLHPEVFTAPTELAFFNDADRFSRGPASYRAEFGAAEGKPIIGEATPGYMMARHKPHIVSERIKKTLPDVRLIAILRNPIDRAYSAMRHYMHRGDLPPDADLVEIMKALRPRRDPLGLLSGGWYEACLRTYAQRFGDRLLVLLHDDALADSHSVYQQALAHIGARTDFAPADLEKVRFSRDVDEAGAGNGRPELTIEQRRELYVYWRTDVEKLERMLARDLSIWDPERVESRDAADA